MQVAGWEAYAAGDKLSRLDADGSELGYMKVLLMDIKRSDIATGKDALLFNGATLTLPCSC